MMLTFGHCFAVKKLIVSCTNYGLAMLLPAFMCITNARTLPALTLDTLSRFRQKIRGFGTTTYAAVRSVDYMSLMLFYMANSFT